ncbi:MAG: hypothetical protein QNJ16_00515 [Rhodobacter sp.]|nr:hypothetical protein [Rhodobacter sp.]
MRPLRQICRVLPVLVAALVLFKAAAAQVYASPEEAAHHAHTLALFNNICLQTLPDFEAAEARFAESGLAGTPGGFWTDDNKGLIARTVWHEGGRQRGCFLALAEANVPALDAELGQVLAAALGRAEVAVVKGPTPRDPSLYLLDFDGYRVTSVVAHASRGYAMLSVSVDVHDGADPPWSAE